MLVIVLVAAIVLAVFLLGVLLIAVSVTMRHGDPSACYKLYAIRDRLIGSVVFQGVSRDDPWLDTLYENVNRILLHSNLVGGPDRWPLAVAAGRHDAANPDRGGKLLPLPVDRQSCPVPIRALQSDLRDALEHLICNHFGLYLQIDAREREQRRIQQEKARDLLEMIDDGNRHRSLVNP